MRAKVMDNGQSCNGRTAVEWTIQKNRFESGFLYLNPE